GILPTVWRGTFLPKTDADIWLAAAFADYERMVARERLQLREGKPPADATKALDQLVQPLQTAFTNASKKLDVALADIKSSTTSNDWYLVASTKGVLLLHALRKEIGAETFDRAMDDFGMARGGERVTSQQFRAHMEKAAARDLGAFFERWLTQKG